MPIEIGVGLEERRTATVEVLVSPTTLVRQVPPLLTVELAVELAAVHEAVLVLLPVVADVVVERGTRFVLVDADLHFGDVDLADCGGVVPAAEALLGAAEPQFEVVSTQVTNQSELFCSRAVDVELDLNSRYVPIPLLKGANDLLADLIERKLPRRGVEESWCGKSDHADSVLSGR